MSDADTKERNSGLTNLANSNGGQAFSRSSRLLKATEFKEVFRKPIVSADHCFRVLARKNEGSVSRLGLAVSKKVDRKAVGRNRIKRIARESFRTTMGARDLVALDIVVLPRLDCSTRSNQQLFESLENHWRRLQSKARKLAADRKECN